MTQTMLMDYKLTDIFWTQAVHTTIHIQNRVIIRNNAKKTPYELWKGRPTNVKHFRYFGSKCYIKREYGRMGKFDSRVENVENPGTINSLLGLSLTKLRH
jgi:hypothetical protein